ncbi:phosphate ABC transporter permease PstA [Ornithinimicrobium faecis]|uniref:Phosphate transport system permease protein PstA n=1 Tax=Ornithinimicrobium faecis TaxID=2934158 RepID=A0ABY4YVE1_9MICO|nr:MULTISPECIES: phosphate ABC transporter permease PstA [unclassified Ornithinimicrobium]USQ80707.1 phosphate ABC transporter permease PstA [Ornithinimicrobium sp. HY1793]
MSTQTEQPVDGPTEHELDHISGVVPSPVRPTTSLPGWISLGGGVLIALALWVLLDANLAVALVGGYVVYVVSVHLAYRSAGGSRVAVDHTMKALIYGAFVLALIPLVSLIWTVMENGALRAFNLDFLQQSMNGVTGVHDKAYFEDGAPMVGGAYHAIIGTLIITGLATLISVPIGLFTAIYLVEYGGKGRLARWVRFMVDVMTGIPSIVAGLFAFALFGVIFGVGTKNGLAGAIALSVLMIPTVVRNSEEMLRIVPNELREASLALGVPKWATIAKVVLPTAASGLASGITLAIARVIGETAPLLVAVGFTRAMNVNPTEGPMMNLALYAYYMFTRPLNPGFRDPSIERAWAAAVLLILIVVILNLTARAIAKVFAPKTSGR